MNTIQGYAVLGAILVLLGITGCTSESYRAESDTSAVSDSIYYIANQDFHTIQEFKKQRTYTEDILQITDVSELDYLIKSDLGFPRIEHILNSYEDTIKRYANRYGFDWRLILAVMNQESRFQVQAVSHRGAYGLMQIMPRTGRDVSTALGIGNVHQPENNIAGGVYYLWRVKNLFEPPVDDENYTSATDEDILKLALAAYNAGRTRVYDAQALAEYLGLDPYRWDVIRDLLPMLSRQYYTLHQYVWEQGRPVGGYFYGWPETINYVDSVIDYYSYYQVLFE